MWIYEHTNWPNFTWDEQQINSLLLEVTHKQGLLLGRMQSLGFELQLEASLENITNDIVKSSAIEGEHLDSDTVRSSVATRLGIDLAGLPKQSRHVDGIVDMMLDATQQYDMPLTKARLCRWHAGLFPTGHSGIQPITVGDYRPASAGKMQVISGTYGKETIHFEAIDASRLEAEMASLFAWLDDTTHNTHLMIQAAIAHLWFVTIHPFEDGNGRIARAISDLLLSRFDQTTCRFYSLSTQIESERKQYYNALEQQQRSDTDITLWLSWFIGCLDRCLDNADKNVEAVLFKAAFWQHANKHSINDRQRVILNKMLDPFEGFMNTSKYAKIAKCSHDTALRDMRELVAAGIFYKNQAGGRSTSYRLATKEELTT